MTVIDTDESSGGIVAAPVRALLTALVDYAGLFPPASLPLEQTIDDFNDYRQGSYSWVLGRFVVPASQLAFVPIDVPVSALAEGPSSLPEADTIEVKASSADDVKMIAGAARGRTIYIETTDLAMLPVIARHGLRAKFRTGGVVPEAVPPTAAVAALISNCVALKLPFKFTAGLHHAVRAERPLTYAADAPQGTMHGFLNVFLAVAVAMTHSDPALVTELLEETDARALRLDDEAIVWRGHIISVPEIRAARSLAVSFGSCSFEEPMADLEEMHWL